MSRKGDNHEKMDKGGGENKPFIDQRETGEARFRKVQKNSAGKKTS